MQTIDIAETKGQIAAYHKLFKGMSKRFMTTFNAVPDEKLHYKPSETSKSAFQVGAHVAASNQFFIEALRGNEMPQDFPAIMKWIDDRAGTFNSREGLTSALAASHQELDNIYANEIEPEAVAASEEFRFYVELPFWHHETHSGQIDYIQTCYGDMAFHF